MENLIEKELESSDQGEEFYNPNFIEMFNKIKQIRVPVKSDLLRALLDGKWHSERELVRMAKKQQYMGSVTLGTMMLGFNNCFNNTYVEKKFINGVLHYKISDNFVGLSRAAFSKYRFRLE
jgi:hypothetical protein